MAIILWVWYVVRLPGKSFLLLITLTLQHACLISANIHGMTWCHCNSERLVFDMRGICWQSPTFGVGLL